MWTPSWWMPALTPLSTISLNGAPAAVPVPVTNRHAPAWMPIPSAFTRSSSACVQTFRWWSVQRMPARS
jgi:hypothetical protein